MAVEPEARIKAACDTQAWDEAATVALEAYGPELMSYLVALLRNASDAEDVFGAVTEGLWRGLPAFRWDSTFRTYAYTIARHAYLKHVRSPRHHVPLSSPAAEAVAAQVRSRTATYLRTETKGRIAELRAQLDPEDQSLLILRVNRQLPWRDIAQILDDDDGTPIDRRAAALRKRFERLKQELRAKAAER
jgi:RNA polymerase sigma-70 factor (ECF subfamily)